jgi:hypothetical protein
LAAKITGPYICGVSRVQFIPPALAKLRPSPPSGNGWLFELKFDGWRVQLHKAGLSSTIYGRNGGDLTRRFPRIAAAVLGLPAKSCIIDGELIAAGRHGEPDFLALLHGRHVPVCVYCFGDDRSRHETFPTGAQSRSRDRSTPTRSRAVWPPPRSWRSANEG